MKALYDKLTNDKNKQCRNIVNIILKNTWYLMAKMMAKGTSFTNAHKKAMKDVGK